MYDFQRMMVDEADMDPVGAVRGGGGGAGGKRGADSPRAAPPKRRAGPLPPHIVARRPSEPLEPPAIPPPRALPVAPAAPVAPVAPLSPASTRRPASPLAPVPSDLPSGRPPEVKHDLHLNYKIYAHVPILHRFNKL